MYGVEKFGMTDELLVELGGVGSPTSRVKDDMIFNQVAATDNTIYSYTHDPLKSNLQNKNTELIHNALMAGGLTPGFGIFFDAADAILYSLEGEFGDAAWSMAAMVPFLGQWAAARKALVSAKKNQENIVTIYRGVGEWTSGKMVKDGVFVSGNTSVSKRMFRDPNTGDLTDMKDMFFTTIHPGEAVGYSNFYAKRAQFYGGKRAGDPHVLKFEIPESYFRDHALDRFGRKIGNSDDFFKSVKNTTVEEYHEVLFEGGLPKGFLTKVYKGGELNPTAVNPRLQTITERMKILDSRVDHWGKKIDNK